MDKLILGTNPILGTNHQSSEVGRRQALFTNVERVTEVLDVALENGASALNFSPDSRLYNVLQRLKQDHYQHEFGIHLMLPDMERFRKVIMAGGTIGVAKELYSGVGWGAKITAAAHSAHALMRSDYSELIESYLGLELSRLASVLPSGARVSSILAHEQLTDMVLALGGTRMLLEFIKRVRSRGIMPGFVTRNFPLFVDTFSGTIDWKEVRVMTPFNPIGFQMTPTRTACENSISKVSSENLSAISLLAGGRVSLKEGLAYLRQMHSIRSIVVGTSSPAHARETFRALKECLEES